jgi:hypothetical protein
MVVAKVIEFDVNLQGIFNQRDYFNFCQGALEKIEEKLTSSDQQLLATALMNIIIYYQSHLTIKDHYALWQSSEKIENFFIGNTALFADLSSK